MNWNPSDPRSLLNVMTELLSEYQKHQQEIMRDLSMLHFEYNSLLEESEGFQLKPEDIEVHVTKRAQVQFISVLYSFIQSNTDI